MEKNGAINSNTPQSCCGGCDCDEPQAEKRSEDCSVPDFPVNDKQANSMDDDPLLRAAEATKGVVDQG